MCRSPFHSLLQESVCCVEDCLCRSLRCDPHTQALGLPSTPNANSCAFGHPTVHLFVLPNHLLSTTSLIIAAHLNSRLLLPHLAASFRQPISERPMRPTGKIPHITQVRLSLEALSCHLQLGSDTQLEFPSHEGISNLLRIAIFAHPTHLRIQTSSKSKPSRTDTR